VAKKVVTAKYKGSRYQNALDLECTVVDDQDGQKIAILCVFVCVYFCLTPF